MGTDRQRPDRGWVCPSRLPKGPNGRNLCRNCGTEVPRGRITFCGDPCVEEWRIASDPGHARRRVWERDLGACVVCGTDTEALRQSVLRSGLTYLVKVQRCKALGYPFVDRSWWEADHIVEVVRGGGACGLDNLQTLCCPCHRAKTARLAADRARERRERSQPALPGLPGLPGVR